MPLSWNEIKTRAVNFSKEWENETNEKVGKAHQQVEKIIMEEN